MAYLTPRLPIRPRCTRPDTKPALATLQLMHDVAEALPPVEFVNTYQAALSQYESNPEAFVPEGATKESAIADALWAELGLRTIDVMVEGAYTLAFVWDSAWSAGGGAGLAAENIPGQAVDPDALRALYIDPGVRAIQAARRH